MTAPYPKPAPGHCSEDPSSFWDGLGPPEPCSPATPGRLLWTGGASLLLSVGAQHLEGRVRCLGRADLEPKTDGGGRVQAVSSAQSQGVRGCGGPGVALGTRVSSRGQGRALAVKVLHLLAAPWVGKRRASS